MRRGSSPAAGRGRQQELERPPARLRQRQAPSRRAPVRDNQILPRHLYPLLGHSYTSHLEKRKEPFHETVLRTRGLLAVPAHRFARARIAHRAEEGEYEGQDDG